VRLSLMLFPDDLQPTDSPQPTSLADRWLLSRVDDLTVNVRRAIESYAFDEAAGSLYSFFWNELCDWYLELIKPVFYHRQDAAEQRAVSQVLLYALDHFLRLCHPIMPMLSEELWHHLPGQRGPLILENMPTPRGRDAQAVAEMDLLQEVVRAARNLRAELGLASKVKAELCLLCEDSTQRQLLESNRGMLEALAAAEPLTWISSKPSRALSQQVKEVEVYLPFPADFDLSKEVKRLEAEKAEAAKFVASIEGKLGNASFVERAKPEVVARERERLAEAQKRLDSVLARLALFAQ